MSTELNEKFDELIKQSEDTILRYFRKYRMGILTKDELECQIREIYHSYNSFLYENGIKKCISEDNWTDVLADYKKWSEGERPDSESNNPWLRTSGSTNPECAASEDERAFFFKIMEFLKLPISYYEPVPEYIAKPDLHVMTYGTGDKISIYGTVDDDGIINDAEPIGKRFVLTDRYGLKTQIEVREVGTNSAGFPEFKGKGTIEGYTSSSLVDITIWTHKNQVFSINAYIYTDVWQEHYDTYRNFPLWQDYFKEREKRNAICLDAIKDFSNKYWEL